VVGALIEVTSFGDFFGDGGFGFSMHFGGGGHGRGYGRGYGDYYGRYYDGYGPYGYGYQPYGYAPYGYAPVAAVAPAQPATTAK